VRARTALTAGLVAAALWLAPGAASAADLPPEEPYVFVVGPRFDMESGVRSVNSMGRVAFAYDDALAEAVRVDETQPAGKAAAISGRLAKGLLLDGPLTVLQVTFVHEVFGHGARARELRLRPTYAFRLVPPYRRLLSGLEADDATAITSYEASGVLDEDIAVVLAGIEADYAAAWWIKVGVMQRGGWAHYRDLLQYTLYRLDHVTSLAVNQGNEEHQPDSAHDIDNYVHQLQLRSNRWRPADRQAIARNLQLGYLVGLADPMLWISATHTLVTYGVRGRRTAQVPRLHVGPWAVLPGLRYALTPFGPEHGVDLFMARDEVVYDVYARAGTGGLAPSLGLGARAFGWTVGAGRLGAELDLWRQPALMFERRHLFDRPQHVGGQVGVHVQWPVVGPVGVVGKLAYKTDGYVMAQPLGAGPVGYLGLSVTPSRD